MLRQQCAAERALHGDQAKRWIALMILQPPHPAATEVAQTIENYDSAGSVRFQGSQSSRRTIAGMVSRKSEVCQQASAQRSGAQ